MTTIYLSTDEVGNIYDILDHDGKVPAIKYVYGVGRPHIHLGLKDSKKIVDTLIDHRGFPENFYSHIDPNNGTAYIGVKI